MRESVTGRGREPPLYILSMKELLNVPGATLLLPYAPPISTP